MISLLLALSLSVWGQQASSPTVDQQRLDAIDVNLNSFMLGRSTVTGTPNFQNGINCTNTTGNCITFPDGTSFNSASTGTWIAYTPTITGMGASPSCTEARYMVIGKTVFVNLEGCSGTGSLTTRTISLPVKSANSDNWVTGSCEADDNGVFQSGPCRTGTTAGSTTLTVSKDWAGNGWTASGSTAIYLRITYESQ